MSTANTEANEAKRGYDSELFCTIHKSSHLRHDGKGEHYCNFCEYIEAKKLYRDVIISGKKFLFKPTDGEDVIYDFDSEMPIASYNFKTKKVIRVIACDYELADTLLLLLKTNNK